MYLSQEFWGKWLNSLKQNGIYPLEYMISFEGFSKKTFPNIKYFYSSL